MRVVNGGDSIADSYNLSTSKVSVQAKMVAGLGFEESKLGKRESPYLDFAGATLPKIPSAA